MPIPGQRPEDGIIQPSRNACIRRHNVFVEALDRLLFETYSCNAVEKAWYSSRHAAPAGSAENLLQWPTVAYREVFKPDDTPYRSNWLMFQFGDQLPGCDVSPETNAWRELALCFAAAMAETGDL